MLLGSHVDGRAFLLPLLLLKFSFTCLVFFKRSPGSDAEGKRFFPLGRVVRRGREKRERQDCDRDDRGRWPLLGERGNICLENLLAPCLKECFGRDLLGKVPLDVTLSCGCSELVEHAASAAVFV